MRPHDVLSIKRNQVTDQFWKMYINIHRELKIYRIQKLKIFTLSLPLSISMNVSETV